MAELTLITDTAAMLRLENAFAELPKQMVIAERDALNRSYSHGKTIAVDDVAKELDANRGSIAKRIRVVAATKANLEAKLIVKGGIGINLIAFHARQTRGGVSVRMAGTRRIFPGTFIARSLGDQAGFNLGANGIKMVAMREGMIRAMTKGRYANRVISRGPRKGMPLLRQPIVPQRGLTVAAIWDKTPTLPEHTINEIVTVLPKNIDSQIDRFIK